MKTKTKKMGLLKTFFWGCMEKLLLKSGAFRKWYKSELGRDLYNLELDEGVMSRKEIYDEKLKRHEAL